MWDHSIAFCTIRFSYKVKSCRSFISCLPHTQTSVTLSRSDRHNVRSSENFVKFLSFKRCVSTCFGRYNKRDEKSDCRQGLFQEIPNWRQWNLLVFPLPKIQSLCLVPKPMKYNIIKDENELIGWCYWKQYFGSVVSGHLENSKCISNFWIHCKQLRYTM